MNELFKQNLDYISSDKIDPKIIENQFVKSDTRYFLKVGEIDCPSGYIVAADPFAYLLDDKISREFEVTVPKGKYEVYTSMFINEMVGIRDCTVKLKIKNTKAVKYELAKQKMYDGEKEPLSVLPVDAGMVCFCDKQVAEEYRIFINNWHKENEGKNHYDDYFREFFNNSYLKEPDFQNEEGDYIEWENPISKNKLVMVSSGLGDGCYQTFIGYDKDNNVCEFIIPMLNPDIFENK